MGNKIEDVIDEDFIDGDMKVEAGSAFTEDAGDIITGIGKNMFEERIPYKDTVAKTLANIILKLLGGVIALHYTLVFVLMLIGAREGGNEWLATDLENLETIFTTVLPVLSGLAGAVVTYYFTKENN